jgi:hypothetical protein
MSEPTLNILLIIDFPDAVLNMTPKELKKIIDRIPTILLGHIDSVPKEYIEYLGCKAISLKIDTPSEENLLKLKEKLGEIVSESFQYDDIVYISPHFWKSRATLATPIKFKHSNFLRTIYNALDFGEPEKIIQRLM